MKSYVVERLCFLKTTFVSGKDALLRAGSGSWSSAKALLPVLLRGILSDFSLIMAQAQAPPPYADIAAVAVAVYLTLLLVELTAALVGGPADFYSL